MSADLGGPLHPAVTLHALPPGETIHTTPGHGYGIDGNVKTSHTKPDLFTLASSRGLRIVSYGEGPTANGYRRVVVAALAVDAGELPWSLPAPASWFDDSGIVEATEEDSPPAAAQALAHAGTTPATVPTTSVPSGVVAPARWGRTIAVGGTLLGLGLLAGWRERRRRR